MMKGYDNWHSKKAEVLQLYLLGKDPRHIAGLTGVPKIRISTRWSVRSSATRTSSGGTWPPGTPRNAAR